MTSWLVYTVLTSIQLFVAVTSLRNSSELSLDRQKRFFTNFLFPGGNRPTTTQGTTNKLNTECFGGTTCTFFLNCYMSGGITKDTCGFFYSCCMKSKFENEVLPTRQYGPVRNDPACGLSSRIEKTSRIVGGEDAEFGQFPWQAYIRVGRSRCGGALVGVRHVVTAAHCVARAKSDVTVVLGDFMLNSDVEQFPSEKFKVSDIRIHPNFRFTPQADRYDVAVLILDRPVRYRPNIKPICLPPKGRDYLGAMGYSAGWGALSPGTKVRPKILQVVDVPIIQSRMCEEWHKRNGITVRIHPEMVCAGYRRGGKDSCQGDSGGPLMVLDRGYWYLVGIVSAGYSCAKEHQPGIYHRVPFTSDWISANVFY